MNARLRPVAWPMYDVNRTAVLTWWLGVADALHREGLDGVPAVPAWPTDLFVHWRDPRLLLSQTCGYPLVTRLASAVQVVGAFRYDAPGCDGIDYRSALVVRRDEPVTSLSALRGRTAAFNDEASLSGFHALRAAAAPFARQGRFFGDAIATGSHRASLAAVRHGGADVAAVDAVTLALIGRHAPHELQGLRVIGHTAAVPGLPLVTAASTSPDALAALRRALQAACADPTFATERDALLISGFEPRDADTWQAVHAVCDAGADVALQAVGRRPVEPAH